MAARLAVFDPSKDTLMRGPATAATLERFAQIPMAPQAAVRLLLALSPDGAMLTTPPSSQSDDADMKLLTYARAEGVVDELGFTGGVLTRARERLAGGQVSYEVRYSDYKDIGAIKFPYLVEATFPAAGTTIKLRYERPIVDGEIADSTFVLAPGPSTRLIDPGMSAGNTASAPRGRIRVRWRWFPCLGMAAVLTASNITGCRVNRPPNDHAATQTLYESMTSDPGTFNPILVTDAASGTAVGDLFEGLVKDNPKTTLNEPDLAQSWEFEDGGKTIIFHLRHDVKWSDGVPFTARDVMFTMRAIYDPHVPNSEVFALTVDGKPIKYEAPDDYTVVMRLPRPFAPLLHSIGVPIVPAHVLETALDAGRFNHTWGIDTPPARLISLGAYRMAGYVPGQLIAFQRYADYWMHDERGGQLPRLHGETELIVPDQNAQYLRFVGGLTDVYSPRPEEVWTLRERAQQLNIKVASIGIDTGSLFFAFNRNPRHYVRNAVTDPRYRWFTDLNFMRALAHSVDKQGMIALCFRGLGVPAVSDISPANRIFYNPNLKDYDYNLMLAARILDEAGYRMLRPGCAATHRAIR